ncbi:PilZ domain-containing protein [Paenibacillus allorhizosphaerae]|uniref:PilZ domain-containing protein n=1 Tax=Paenibacillus allorhizosphaerae TaxID=2849866 RepID=A0ABN7TVR3_9BACL|nr:PilZ domain-containing protein [Paenibacillus allorhizosphaerae]CAG7652130.1 hypothetical protein PAECIP111802_05144 [Paenibacillus allorhizosphaerae]
MFLLAFSALLCSLVIIVIMLLSIISYNKEMKLRNSQIEKLDVTIMDLNQKLKEANSRKSYRIPIPVTEGEFEFVEIGNAVHANKVKRAAASIRDISLTGLRFNCHYDFSVREKIIVKMYFVLRNEPLELTGRIVRKEEYFGKPYLTYGMEFLITRTSEQESLFRLLRDIEAEQAKKLRN